MSYSPSKQAFRDPRLVLLGETFLTHYEQSLSEALAIQSEARRLAADLAFEADVQREADRLFAEQSAKELAELEMIQREVQAGYDAAELEAIQETDRQLEVLDGHIDLPEPVLSASMLTSEQIKRDAANARRRAARAAAKAEKQAA